jgi:hypothetical protein
MGADTQRISANVPEPLHRRIRMLAAKEHVRVADLVIRALVAAYGKRKEKGAADPVVEESNENGDGLDALVEGLAKGRAW